MGTVYVACVSNTTNCTYVVKIQELYTGGTWSESAFYNEVCILRQLKKTNIAPKIYDAWICRGNGYIIMDKLAGSMNQVSARLIPLERRGTPGYDYGNKIRQNLYRKARVKLEQLHNKNITFGDLHGGNILVSTMNLTDPKIEVFFTDFGYAVDWNGRLDQIVEYIRIPNIYHERFKKPTSFERAKRLDKVLLRRIILEEIAGQKKFDGLLEHPENDYWKV